MLIDLTINSDGALPQPPPPPETTSDKGPLMGQGRRHPGRTEASRFARGLGGVAGVYRLATVPSRKKRDQMFADQREGGRTGASISPGECVCVFVCLCRE